MSPKMPEVYAETAESQRTGAAGSSRPGAGSGRVPRGSGASNIKRAGDRAIPIASLRERPRELIDVAEIDSRPAYSLSTPAFLSLGCVYTVVVRGLT
jgi:hypothetical protein